MVQQLITAPVQTQGTCAMGQTGTHSKRDSTDTSGAIPQVALNTKGRLLNQLARQPCHTWHPDRLKLSPHASGSSSLDFLQSGQTETVCTVCKAGKKHCTEGRRWGLLKEFSFDDTLQLVNEVDRLEIELNVLVV